MTEPNPIEIELPVCHYDGPRPMTEALEVIQCGPQQYELLFSPGVVEGVAKGDVIELTESDPKGFRVIRRSGNLCVWFYFAEVGRNRGPDGEHVRAVVKRFGGVCDGGANTNLVFSIPISLGFGKVEAMFSALVEQFPGSSWLYGNVYDPWNDFRPLGWWNEAS